MEVLMVGWAVVRMVGWMCDGLVDRWMGDGFVD
jgi:hypothetical protein